MLGAKMFWRYTFETLSIDIELNTSALIKRNIVRFSVRSEESIGFDKGVWFLFFHICNQHFCQKDCSDDLYVCFRGSELRLVRGTLVRFSQQLLLSVGKKTNDRKTCTKRDFVNIYYSVSSS